jgi:hypothetical protein
MNVLGKYKLNRRAMLRGAGTVAIALPWLEIMGADKAHAAAAPAKRFLGVYTPGGTVADKFWPTGSADAPVLGQILKPLEPHFSKVLALKGLSMTKIWNEQGGEQHQAGICSLLTGVAQPGAGKYPKGGSIDQVLASKIQADLKPKQPGDPDNSYARKSLQLAIRWATGKSHGLLHPINSLNFDDGAGNAAIAPQLDPKDIFKTLFGSVEAGTDMTAENARTKSILDYVIGRYEKLNARLGAEDKARLDQHLTKLRELELSIGKGDLGGTQCKPPTMIDTTGYNATTGLNSSDDGSKKDTTTDAKIPARRQVHDGHDGDGLRVRPDRRRHVPVVGHRSEAHLPLAQSARASPLLSARRQLPPGRVRADQHLVLGNARLLARRDEQGRHGRPHAAR